MTNKNEKVLQFFTDGVKRRTEKSFYAPVKQWNPNQEIGIYTLNDIPVLQNEGIIFKQVPDLTVKGMSTFIQNPMNEKEYISIERFGDYIIANREKILINILGLLGIRDYFVKTEYHVGAGFGKKDDGQFNLNAGNSLIAKEEMSAENHSFVEAHMKMHKLEYKYKILKPFTPTQEQWEEAKYLAMRAGLFDNISDIINLRKPGNNPSLLFDKTKIRMDGDVNININIASKLKALAGFKGITGSCGFLSALDFKAYANGEYETTVIYNFDANRDDQYIQSALDSELKEK